MKIAGVKAGRRDIHQSNRIVRVERDDCISPYRRCMTLHGSEIREQRVINIDRVHARMKVSNHSVSKVRLEHKCVIATPLPVIMLWKFEPGV